MTSTEATERRVLVTGASRGIGRAVARELARAGHPIAVHYRSGRDEAEALGEEIRAAGGSAICLGFDVSDADATEAAILADIEANGAYWGLVVNAGITNDAPLASMSREAWTSVLRTNLDGFYHVTHPALMPMVRLRDGGRIVTMSSYSGLHGNAGQTNYSASKAGLIGATRSLALEVAKRRITVNSVAPGFIDTDMVKGLPDDVIANIPLKRMGRAEEVADLVAFLFSEGAGYMTGQAIAIDGGL